MNLRYAIQEEKREFDSANEGVSIEYSLDYAGATWIEFVCFRPMEAQMVNNPINNGAGVNGNTPLYRGDPLLFLSRSCNQRKYNV